MDRDGGLTRDQGEFLRPVARGGVTSAAQWHQVSASGGESMETVGFVGVGKIGLPIAENLIKSGYRVLGYRRSSLADFEKLGGIAARSPADIGAQCDVILSCVPTVEAVNEVVNGPNGLIHSARHGQIIVELGSHPIPDKKKHVGPLAQKG